jgi:hypothetical protein
LSATNSNSRFDFHPACWITDGVNAYSGMLMAPPHSIFVSFDRKAVRLLGERGVAALTPDMD